MIEGDLTNTQLELVLKFCDVLGIEDLSVAILMLKECNWDINKALCIEEPNYQKSPIYQPEPPKHESSSNNPEIPKSQSRNIPIVMCDESEEYDYNEYNNPHDNEENDKKEFEYDYGDYQQELDREKEIQEKRRIFDMGFTSIPLEKTKSDVGNNLEDEVGMNKQISQDHFKHRGEYQANLLKNSAMLCDRIMNSKSPEIRKCYDSIKKSQNNLEFLSNLHKKYQTKINFTFGTFLLNLSRSYLDKKLLLVYIHKSEFENNNSIKMIMSNREISSFANKHCICYGMYDNSDDYDILQKYAPMKNLPSFLLFKFNKTELKEELVSQYLILKSGTDSLLEWLAFHAGIILKKRIRVIETFPVNASGVPVVPPAPAKNEESKPKKNEMENIIYEQNLEYEEMARLHELKRNKSAMRKESEEIFEQSLEKMKENFSEEPVHEAGVTIQFRFRLPQTGKSLMRTFNINSKIMEIFEYIHCFGRDEFEERLAEFDLTQTFPILSLADKKDKLIAEVFTDSERENLIVQEL